MGREILDHFRPDRRDAYALWYLDKIKPHYDIIASHDELIQTES